MNPKNGALTTSFLVSLSLKNVNPSRKYPFFISLLNSSEYLEVSTLTLIVLEPLAGTIIDSPLISVSCLALRVALPSTTSSVFTTVLYSNFLSLLERLCTVTSYSNLSPTFPKVILGFLSFVVKYKSPYAAAATSANPAPC